MQRHQISSKGKDFLETRVLNRSENEAKTIKSLFYMQKNIRSNNCIRTVVSVGDHLYSGLGTSSLEDKVQASLQRGLTLLRRNPACPPVTMFRKAAQQKATKELALLIETTTHAVRTALTKDRDLPTLMDKEEGKGEKTLISQLQCKKDSKSEPGNYNHNVIPFFKNFRIFSSKCLSGARIKV